MKCSGCDRGKEGKCTRYQRRWDFYEWVDAFKGPKVNSLSKMIYWRKIHFFYVTPWKLFFFPFISPRDRICKGWTRGMHKHPITPAALLGQEGAVGGKCGCQECVTAESVRSGVGATTATQVEDQAVGKLLLGTDNLTHCPGVLLLRALLFDCLLLRVTEKQKKVQGFVSLNSCVWSWGNSLWGRFRFGALKIRAVSVLLLVCVIRRKEWIKLVWTEKEMTQTIAHI